ncbi:MAG: hypothetical protein Ta2B_19480 [Termitinemataceae bacterium]|nr:MAG: hypothetical protein Ta2B_19480 [Termitinemataceae bacterium]
MIKTNLKSVSKAETVQTYPKVVPTKMPSLSKAQQEEIVYSIDGLRFDYLRELHKAFFKKRGASLNMRDMVQAIISAVSWKSLTEFDAWITTYPPEVQNIIYTLVFYEKYPEEKLRISKNKPLAISTTEHSIYYEHKATLDPDLNLGFIFAAVEKQQTFLFINKVLRKILLPWFEIPQEYSLSSCKAAQSPSKDIIYNNEKDIIESLPLLAEFAISLNDGVSTYTEKEKLMKGLGKKQRTELIKQTGFKTFSPEIKYSPFAEDLAVRFLLCVTSLAPKKIEDTYEEIKALFDLFFDTAELKTNFDMYRSGFLETSVLIDHLTKKTRLYYLGKPPVSRKIFLEILKTIANEDAWFDAEKLSHYAFINDNEFNFFDHEYDTNIGLTASSIIVDEIIYTEKYNYIFNVAGLFRLELLIKPLFKAYCYLFAAFGILEITQKEPQLRCLKKEVHIPISDYDSLALIRITEFGKWCLGINNNRPAVAKNNFEAIADKELLLITVKGNSLALKILLDKIGSKLGDNRWRVSYSSFLSGCTKKDDVVERINNFRKLIDKSPAPVWERLFDQALNYYGFFSANIVEGFIFNLDLERLGRKTLTSRMINDSEQISIIEKDKSGHQKIIDEILKDPRLKGIAMRAEGRMLVVPRKHKNTFLQIIADYGILDNL